MVTLEELNRLVGHEIQVIINDNSRPKRLPFAVLVRVENGQIKIRRWHSVDGYPTTGRSLYIDLADINQVKHILLCDLCMNAQLAPEDCDPEFYQI